MWLVDLEKTFECVPQGDVPRPLVVGPLLLAIQSLYKCSKCFVRITGSESDPSQMGVGSCKDSADAVHYPQFLGAVKEQRGSDSLVLDCQMMCSSWHHQVGIFSSLLNCSQPSVKQQG